MTRYLLDTTALVDFSKGQEPASSRVLGWIHGGDDVGICDVVIAEFYAGVPVADRPRWDALIGALQYWPITRLAARQAGLWRYDFARQGIALATADTLVAAVALERSAVLVTDNPRHYPMPGLRLQSIRV
ncbi:MAG TPA: PIN domain-containing protein [Chloroflexota bacterium]|jgi:predicted nucleic acid-binding protein